jgi:hypothetical protein
LIYKIDLKIIYLIKKKKEIIYQSGRKKNERKKKRTSNDVVGEKKIVYLGTPLQPIGYLFCLV